MAANCHMFGRGYMRQAVAMVAVDKNSFSHAKVVII